MVDQGFFDAMGLKLKAGRWFDPNRAMDDQTLPTPSDPAAERALTARGINVVITESAVKTLGFKTPQNAIGKTFKAELYSDEAGQTAINVIGVVGDARFRSLRDKIQPLMFRKAREGPSWMIIRYQGDPGAVRAAVEQKWKELAPEVPFEAKFSEDIVRELYNAEQSRAQIFAAFSLLAVIIGCLGLFGLAAFTAERRTKEIGIRKVLGARTRDIVRLLVWQFSRPVIIANIIAWPVAWWMMRDWLNGFDQRIALTPVPFVIAAAIALGIAVGNGRWPFSQSCAGQAHPRPALRVTGRVRDSLSVKDSHHVAELLDSRGQGTCEEQDLLDHQHRRPRHRHGGVHHDPALHPLRAELRQMASGRG